MIINDTFNRFDEQVKNIFAQNIISIDHITKDNGLSYHWVWDITQDNRGFIWFTNHTGLRRYDGKNFVTYQHSEGDSTTISTNTITRINRDHEFNIWAYGTAL